ncbi:MAG: chorismate-binding protein [Pseudobdellovibrionaceae bacterium]
MTQAEIKSFLKSGALIRLPSGKLRLWMGPFKACEPGKEQVFSIACMEFFGGQPEFFESSQPVIETEVSTLRALLQEQITEAPLAASSFFQPSFEKFQESFQTIQGKIHRGEIEKALPVVFAECPVIPSPSQRASMLAQALEAHPQLYVFGFWNEASGILGATPEILFHLKGKSLKTMALAGTHPRAEEKDLLRNPKELKEHQLVVQDLKEKLEKLGWVKIGETHVAEYGILSHLKTDIEVEISDVSIQELLKRLHPTAALGVYPRNYGIQWMKALPYQEQRGLFGGPVVFPISRTESLALVAIRCLQWNENGSQIGTGCGIVEASDLHREWKELALKRESVMKVLGLSI